MVRSFFKFLQVAITKLVMFKCRCQVQSTCERTKGSLALCLVAVWIPGGLLENPPRWHATIYSTGLYNLAYLFLRDGIKRLGKISTLSQFRIEGGGSSKGDRLIQRRWKQLQVRITVDEISVTSMHVPGSSRAVINNCHF